MKFNRASNFWLNAVSLLGSLYTLIPKKYTNKLFVVYLFSQLSTPIISHTPFSPIISNSRHLFTYQWNIKREENSIKLKHRPKSASLRDWKSTSDFTLFKSYDHTEIGNISHITVGQHASRLTLFYPSEPLVSDEKKTQKSCWDINLTRA